MRVLLTNDDGIDSPAFQSLIRVLQDDFKITVVAPQQEMSAVSHALTIKSPLFCEERIIEDHNAIGVRGTPADCVKLALDRFMPEPPDLVISGINKGANVGINIFYSGTVAAAMQATLAGIPSFAVSLASFSSNEFQYASRVAHLLARQIMRNRLPSGIMLNVNVPDLPSHLIKGVRATRQGKTVYHDHYIEKTDPRGDQYFWLDGSECRDEHDLSIDHHALNAGWISVTPLISNLTANGNVSGVETDFAGLLQNELITVNK